MTLRAVAWSAARTCTIAVTFTLTAGSMPIVAILFFGRCRLAAAHRDKAAGPSRGGTSEETYLEPVPPLRPPYRRARKPD